MSTKAAQETSRPYTLQTERLSLRLANPNSAEDCEKILKTYTDDQTGAGGHGKVGLSSIEDIRYKYFLHGPRADFCTLAPPPQGHFFLVSLRQDGNVEGDYIGIAGISFRASMPYPDLGWAIFGPYQGYGYATEAARAALKFWREVAGVKEVCAIVEEENERSERLAERVGFVKAGTLEIFFGVPPEEQRKVGRGFVVPGTEWKDGLWIRPTVNRPEDWRWEGGLSN